MFKFLEKFFKVQYFWDKESDPLKTEIKTPRYEYTCDLNYDINISKNGMHVFATDSYIRSYTEAHLRDIILLFKEKFPESEGYFINISCFKKKQMYALPENIQAALEGKYTKTRSDKVEKKRKKVLEIMSEQEEL